MHRVRGWHKKSWLRGQKQSRMSIQKVENWGVGLGVRDTINSISRFSFFDVTEYREKILKYCLNILTQ